MGTVFLGDKPNNQSAFLFPGQGSQFVGMGKELFDGSAAARAVFEEVDTALEFPLTNLIFNGPEESLRDTTNSQPGIMSVSLATLEAMRAIVGKENIIIPAFLAGHSLGEYTALAAAGVLSISDAARLARERGKLMQAACELRPGGMAAILGLDELTVEEICHETGSYISNINTERQIVVSGTHKALAIALDLASARGARKVVHLNVSGAFHSQLMDSAKEGLIETVSSLTFNEPSIPIIGNANGIPLTSSDSLKEELIIQMSSCVQWKKSVDFILDAGVSNFIELGPGRVLSGLVKNINRRVNVSSIGDISSINNLMN